MLVFNNHQACKNYCTVVFWCQPAVTFDLLAASKHENELVPSPKKSIHEQQSMAKFNS